MADGLEWQLNLEAKTGGADAMLSKLDSIDATLKKIDGGLGKTAKASDAAGAAHKKHAGEAEHLGGVLGGLTHHFEKIVALVAEWDAAEFLLDLPKRIFEVGEEILEVGAKAQRTESSFKLLFGARGGTEALEDIEAIGKHTEFTHDRIKALTQDLGKSGFEGQSLKRARGLALDLAALSGNKEEGLGEALSAIERIKLTGRVDARTLRGAGIGESDYFTELTKRTGKSRKELKKEMEEGKLDAQVAMTALEAVVTKKTGKALGGAADEMSKNLDATFTHLGELPERYYEKLIHSPGFAKFEAMFSKVLEELDPESPQGKRIFGALEDTFNGLAGIMSNFDIASAIELGIEELEDLEREFLAFMSLIPGDTGHRAEKTLKDMDDRKSKRDHQAAEDKAYADQAAANGTTSVFERAGEAALAKEAGKNAGKGYSSGITQSIAGTEKANEDHAEKGIQALEDTIQVQSPSKRYRKLGEYSGEGYAIGIKRSSRGVDDAIDEMASFPSGQGRFPGPEAIHMSTVAASGTGGGARTITLEPHITVNLNGGHGGAAETAQAVASAVADILPSALQSAIDNLAVQSGAS